MADPNTQQIGETTTGAVEVSEFDSLLRKEFKPKTDEAKEAVERAVRTLAEQALADTQLIGTDVVQSIEAIIAQLDKKLTEQINLILHHEDFQKLEGGVARAALPGEQHRNRRDAEDSRDEHQQAGPRQDAQALQGHGLGSEPDLQEGLRGRVRPVRRRAVRLPGRRLLLRSEPARRRAARARSRRPAAAAHTPFIARRQSRRSCRWDRGRSSRTRATSPRSSRRRSTPRGDRCANPRTRATSAWRCRASWRGCPTAPRPIRSRSSTSKRTPAAADHTKYAWANSAYAMATNITRSFKLYGWCSRIRGVESGGSARRSARPHVPDRRRRRRHEVPDRDCHQRPS